MGELGAGNEGLGRNASGPEAVAAQGWTTLPFDECNLSPETRATRGSDKAGSASADDDNVKLFWHAVTVALRGCVCQALNA